MALNSFLGASLPAIEAGKVDDCDDSLWSWMYLAVDEVGWKRTVEVGENALRTYEQIAKDSRERVNGFSEPLVPIIVAVAAFAAVERTARGR